MTDNSMRTGWRQDRLRDICDRINYGYTASAKHESVGPQFLRITDIVPDIIDWSSVPHCEISESDYDKYRLEGGDIVVARTGATTGYAKQVRKPHGAVFASYLVRFRPDKKKVCSRYVGIVVESDDYKRFVKTNLGGAAQPQANAQILGSYPIPLPPLPAQQKIAATLSAYDDLIENNTRRIKLLEEMAQTIYREWFISFRFPGREKLKMVQSELGPIPEEWEVRRLIDLSNIVMGQSPKSEFYNQEGRGLPFHQGVTDFGDRFPVHRVYCTLLSRIAERGDILFSVRAPVGRINVADQKIVIGRGLCAIRSREGNQAFIFQQLKELFKEEDTMGGGTIFKAVTKGDMQGIRLLSPPPDPIREFEKMVEPLFAELEILTAKNVNLRRTRDLLLPKLISGVLDVSSLDIDTSNLDQ